MPPKKSRKRKAVADDNEGRATKRANNKNVTNNIPHPSAPAKTLRKSPRELKAIVKSINDELSDSSVSSSSEEDFEDVPIANGAEEEDEEMDWEDALTSEPAKEPAKPSKAPTEISDLNLTLSKPDAAPDYSILKDGKKGPSKIERAIRIDTHGIHVLGLLWHNTIRNSWCNDKEVQATLLNGLSEGIRAEIEKWRVTAGLQMHEEKSKKVESKKKSKGKDKISKKDKKSRDWSHEAERQERGKPDLSRGDPTILLLKHLSAYWKKRFRIEGPSLRKRGYKNVIELNKEMKAYAADPTNAARFGEQIASKDDFRIAAKRCAGSRDLGAQLFTALLRALNIEARLVASLQPAGFGWSKVEEAKVSKENSGSDYPSSVVPTKQKTTKTTKKGAQALAELDSSSDSELSAMASDIDSDSISMPSIKSSASKKQLLRDLPFPTYWTEALSPVTSTYYAITTQLTPNVATNSDGFEAYEPRGAAAEKAKQVICYVIAYSADGSAKDVTVRYLKRRQLPGKTKGFRLPPEKVPVYNKRGTKIVKHIEIDWFKKVMRFYARPGIKRTQADEVEDEGDLMPFKAEKVVKPSGTMPDSLQAFKASQEFVLERHLRREQAMISSAKPVMQFKVGKGEKEQTEPVFRRQDVVPCKTVESWHKEGREVKVGAQPLKLVPIRAVTATRKQEVEHVLRETGEKPLQGLYSRDQTQWIIPPPIKNGQIPKNAYGNIDVYVPSMVPKGAVHIPYGGTVKVCKKLGIDYAEACTGFEFGRQMAVPVLTGVVVAEEHEDAVIDAWEVEEEKKRRREDEKREKRILALWRKFATGLKIMERVQAEYGVDDLLEIAPSSAKAFKTEDNHLPYRGHGKADKHSIKSEPVDFEKHAEDFGGGFMPEGTEFHEPATSHLEIQLGSQVEHKSHDDNLQDGENSTDKRKKAGPKSLRAVHQEDALDEEPDVALDDALDAADTDDSEDSRDETEEKDDALSAGDKSSVDTSDTDSDDSEDSDESDFADEEYGGFVKLSQNSKTSSTPARTQSRRQAATQSPYFKKKR